VKRLLLYTGLAFVAGALLGAALVFPGGPLSSAAPSAVLFVHVENAGTDDMQARVEILDASGSSVATSTFKVPAHSSVEKTVVNLKAGAYDVRATFSANGAAATGNAHLDTAACATGSYPMATFAVDATNGVSLRDGGTASCRA